MSTNEAEAEAGAIGNAANANNNNANARPPVTAAQFGAHIPTLNESRIPVDERLTTLRIILELLLRDDIPPPIQQAVDAGILPVLNSWLTKSPSDWIFEILSGRTSFLSAGDAGSSNMLMTISTWIPQLLSRINKILILAVGATRQIVIVDHGRFRDDSVNQGLLETLAKIQEYQEVSEQLRRDTFTADVEFFRNSLRLPPFNAARPAIGLLARFLTLPFLLLLRLLANTRIQEEEYYQQEVSAKRRLRYVTVAAVVAFFQDTLRLPPLDAARPAIGFLARSLRENGIDLNQQDSPSSNIACLVLATFRGMASRDNIPAEYIEEMMTAGVADIVIGLMRDLMQVEDHHEDSFLWTTVTDCITSLVLKSSGDDRDHWKGIFIDAGIADISLGLLRQENDTSSLIRIFVWVHILMESRIADHKQAFINAGIADVLPRLLAHESVTVQNYGCCIASKLSSSIASLLLENGSVQQIAEIASRHRQQHQSGDDADKQLCISAILALVGLLAEENCIVQNLISMGYHRPVVDALDGALFHMVPEQEARFWTEAAAQVRGLM